MGLLTMIYSFLSVAGSTERFTAIIALLVAVLGLLGMIGKAGVHIIHTVDALLEELHANTRAIKEMSDSKK